MIDAVQVGAANVTINRNDHVLVAQTDPLLDDASAHHMHQLTPLFLNRVAAGEKVTRRA